MANKPRYIEHPLLKPNKVERRLYQERILASIIGKNSLVVLPTGLGKTLIALTLAVYYLSEKEDGKVIFLAPSKPLVVQHKKSFAELTVFEDKELPVLTGSVEPSKRKVLFRDARIAFMTPQVLQNDLVSGRIDLKDVVLIIFDEAHRAVGDYAYTFIARYYRQVNPKGKILAMSASPGGTKEKIGEVCNNLFIEHIEIKTADSPDVRPYIKENKIEWIRLRMPPEYVIPHKNLEKLLKEFLDKLISGGVLEKERDRVTRKDVLECSNLIDKEIRATSDAGRLTELFNLKKIASNAVRIMHMLELLETQGVKPLYEYLQKSRHELNSPGASKSLRELFSLSLMREVFDNIKALVDMDFIHPKLQKLGELISEQLSRNPDSRILVFANYRDTVSLITEYLMRIEGIRPARFVGQQHKKVGRRVIRGMSQKEQIAILEDFRSGKYNTLVATSVAEEGLDIAECDLVIFYDVVPSEIRTIQRRGRTARKKSGKTYILMMSGTREEGYYWAEKKREREMQRTLKELKGIGLKLEETLTRSKVSSGSGRGAQKTLSEIISVTTEHKGGSPPVGVARAHVDETETVNHHSSETAVNDDNNKKSSGEDGIDFTPGTPEEIVMRSDFEELFEDHHITPSSVGGTPEGITVIVDSAEGPGGVVKHLALGGADVILRRIPVADYVISDKIAIERKTGADFVSSIKDGRLFRELINLKSDYAIPLLVLEGNPVGAGGITRNAVWGAISSIIINMGITVISTSGPEETAELILSLARKVQKDKKSRPIIAKSKVNTYGEIQERIIGGFPGVNLKRAQELLRYFSTIKNIVNADTDDLQKIPGIGKKTAKKIKDIVESDYNDVFDKPFT